MNIRNSLMVLFLLYLKGLVVQTDTVFFPSGSVCAPAGSDVAVGFSCILHPGWIFQAWKLGRNNTETLVDPQKDSRYKYFKDSYNTCYLRMNRLKETDAGTYYMSFTYRGVFTSKSPSEMTVHVTDLQVSVDSDQNVTLTCKTSCPLKQTFIWFKNGLRLDLQDAGDLLHVSGEDSDRYSCALKRFETFPSAETLLNVNHVAYESVRFITLWSFLIPVVLLLVCAALWMILNRKKKLQNQRRPEGEEKNREDDTVYENDQALVNWYDASEYTCVVFRPHNKLHRETFAEDTVCHMTMLPATEHRNNKSIDAFTVCTQ